MLDFKEIWERRGKPNTAVSKNGCIEILRKGQHSGHVRIRVGRKKYQAHRLAWIAERGPIPEGMAVCHKCDNPPCVNPDHLFLGTQTENIADMDRKGRRGIWRPTGEKHGMAVLIESDVKAILERLKSGLSQSKVGREFSVSRGCIQAIANGRSWTHIERPNRFQSAKLIGAMK